MKSLKLATILVLLALFLVPTSSFSAESIDPSALSAAEGFLNLLDDSEYQLAWSQTSVVNQTYTGYPEWFRKTLAVRPHLGQTLERTLAKTSRHNSWGGLPDGDYVRISFSTRFLNKADSLETVVLIREGSFWSISGYYLR